MQLQITIITTLICIQRHYFKKESSDFAYVNLLVNARIALVELLDIRMYIQKSQLT